MEVTEKYINLNERQVKIVFRESQGLRMLHDNFDPDWESGDEPYGTMTFTDIMPPSPPPVITRDLAKEIDDLKIKVAALEVKAVI